MGFWDDVLELITDDRGKVPVKDIASFAAIGADAAATFMLARKIEKYQSNTERRIREINEFLNNVEDKANLTDEELSKLKVLVSDLINEVNDKTLATLIENVPETEKVKIIEHFVALKRGYHTILTTIMVELNRVLQEEGEGIKSTIESNLASLSVLIENDSQKVHQIHLTLIENINEVKADISNIKDLISDLDYVSEMIQNYKNDLESLSKTTKSVLSNVHKANEALNRSRASAILLLISGALIGFLGNLVANTIEIPHPHGLIALILLILIFLFIYIKRRMDL